MENIEKETKTAKQLRRFDVKISVEGIDLTCVIHGADPLDVITLAGYVISHFRKNGKEPSIVVLP